MAITESELESSVRRAQREKNQKAIALLRSWVETGDAEEQHETFAALKRGLNAHNSSGRIIYP